MYEVGLGGVCVWGVSECVREAMCLRRCVMGMHVPVTVSEVLSGTKCSAYQDEVRLVGGQHEHGNVLVGQRGNDRLGDLGHTNGLGAGEAAATRHHIQGQPGGICHTQMLRGGQLWTGMEKEAL